MRRLAATALFALLGLLLLAESYDMDATSGGSWEWSSSSSLASDPLWTTASVPSTGGWSTTSYEWTTTGGTAPVTAMTGGGAVDGIQGGDPVPYPRAVVFKSEADNLVAGDTNKCADVFHYDMLTGKLTRVSVASDGLQGDLESGSPSVSADGFRVAFSSRARNLVPDDFNNAEDVFVHDLRLSRTFRVSVSADGRDGDAWSGFPCISPDGQFVSFASSATNLIPNLRMPQNPGQIFVRDCAAGTTRLITAGPNGLGGNSTSVASSISTGGTKVAFSSASTDLIPGPARPPDALQIYLYDRTDPLNVRTELLSLDKNNNPMVRHTDAPCISADGQVVAFSFQDPDLDFRFVVRIDDLAKKVRMDIARLDGVKPDRGSNWPSLSWDGRYVGFSSEATNLLMMPAKDTNFTWDAFRYDRITKNIERMSVDSNWAEVTGGSWKGRISLDGQFMAFDSLASGLAGANPNQESQVYVRYAGFGVTRRISEAAGFPGNGPSTDSSMN